MKKLFAVLAFVMTLAGMILAVPKHANAADLSPLITRQPQSTYWVVTADAEFTVQAVGMYADSVLEYDWFIDGRDIRNPATHVDDFCDSVVYTNGGATITLKNVKAAVHEKEIFCIIRDKKLNSMVQSESALVLVEEWPVEYMAIPPREFIDCVWTTWVVTSTSESPTLRVPVSATALSQYNCKYDWFEIPQNLDIDSPILNRYRNKKDISTAHQSSYSVPAQNTNQTRYYMCCVEGYLDSGVCFRIFSPVITVVWSNNPGSVVEKHPTPYIKGLGNIIYENLVTTKGIAVAEAPLLFEVITGHGGFLDHFFGDRIVVKNSKDETVLNFTEPGYYYAYYGSLKSETFYVSFLNPTPTNSPTPTPTKKPTPTPTKKPTPTPTTKPTNTPTPTNSPTPTNTPTPEPTNTPSPEPTKAEAATPTPEPTKEATPTPTPEPTKEATPTPSPEPTKEATPTPEPTREPTPEPTTPPTDLPATPTEAAATKPPTDPTNTPGQGRSERSNKPLIITLAAVAVAMAGITGALVGVLLKKKPVTPGGAAEKAEKPEGESPKKEDQ